MDVLSPSEIFPPVLQSRKLWETSHGYMSVKELQDYEFQNNVNLRPMKFIVKLNDVEQFSLDNAILKQKKLYDQGYIAAFLDNTCDNLAFEFSNWKKLQVLFATRKFAKWKNGELKWETTWQFSDTTIIGLINFDCVVQQLKFELGTIDAFCERYTTVIVNIVLYQK